MAQNMICLGRYSVYTGEEYVFCCWVLSSINASQFRLLFKFIISLLSIYQVLLSTIEGEVLTFLKIILDLSVVLLPFYHVLIHVF